MGKENHSYIAFGSNKGDKLQNMKKALQEIIADKNNTFIRSSSVYETKPYGYKEQDNFYNATVEIKTSYELIELLDYLKYVEKKLGRGSSPRWGPREIDLDILFYNDLVFSNDRITVPHKEIANRDFVLVPLCEIAPDYYHPVLKQKICDICISDSEETVISKIQQKLI
jgi:2-amino-4-hydroxy-6-hydroxymethyldihydropteridine diphosphokinase